MGRRPRYLPRKVGTYVGLMPSSAASRGPKLRLDTVPTLLLVLEEAVRSGPMSLPHESATVAVGVRGAAQRRWWWWVELGRVVRSGFADEAPAKASAAWLLSEADSEAVVRGTALGPEATRDLEGDVRQIERLIELYLSGAETSR